MLNAAVWTGMFFLLLALVMLNQSIKKYRLYQQSKGWPYVYGKYFKGEIELRMGTRRQRNYLTEYEYEVAGTVYQGNQTALYPVIYKEEAEALDQKFRPGDKVQVFYNPKDPSQAVLIVGGRAGKEYGEIILSCVVLIIAVGVMWGGLNGYIGG